MNKNIVVVGASRGIGQAIVALLAEETSNHIIALSRNLEKMQSEFSTYENVQCFALDLNKTNVRSQCESIFDTIDSIDILINNAGKLISKPFAELSREEIEECYNVNILGVIQTTQAAVPKMNKAHIVNISSIGGFQGSVKFPGLSAYSSSKAALCSFTEMFSEEYKNTEITMNCLCLGAVQTEMFTEAFPSYEAPISASKMAKYIVHFAMTANDWIKGKIIPVTLSTP